MNVNGWHILYNVFWLACVGVLDKQIEPRILIVEKGSSKVFTHDCQENHWNRSLSRKNESEVTEKPWYSTL